MQRKKGTLTNLEAEILSTALELGPAGQQEFYGFLIAKQMKERQGALFRTAYGPLYKALDRMAEQGLLDSRWEDPEVAALERRPRRCLYRVTGAGQLALEAHRAGRPAIVPAEGEAST